MKAFKKPTDRNSIGMNNDIINVFNGTIGTKAAHVDDDYNVDNHTYSFCWCKAV